MCFLWSLWNEHSVDNVVSVGEWGNLLVVRLSLVLLVGSVFRVSAENLKRDGEEGLCEFWLITRFEDFVNF